MTKRTIWFWVFTLSLCFFTGYLSGKHSRQEMKPPDNAMIDDIQEVNTEFAKRILTELEPLEDAKEKEEHARKWSAERRMRFREVYRKHNQPCPLWAMD